ncbi:hypothetical protein [Marinilactibacillus psychrotolerans]|uniref:Transposase n=1 Tax=Marinilactibacillus psychrotolerans TaxID=191770 RepID=A0AAV3WQB5_9LACT|nr:hypothetical protein [Marinilactibacillus psychrotolerans]GEL67601.1 hypothetical protein MPS01_17560 [Marinilactibacillus psychrotolerans]GEQ35515.1 hypothetical protein M132T_10230 [Marinilactibacillus psychrotolerans]
MEKNKQAIVPIKLQENQKDLQTATNALPQKVVAHLKRSQTELFIYEGIKPSTLRILLTEMAIHETH